MTTLSMSLARSGGMVSRASATRSSNSCRVTSITISIVRQPEERGNTPMVIAAVRHRLPGERTLRIAAVIIVGLIGGWIGMLLGGRAQTPVGPADVAMSLRPSWSGGTVVDIPPLGTLRLDTHRGPLRLDAQVARLRPEPARRLIEHPDELDRLTTTIGGEVRHGVIMVALRAGGVAAGRAALGRFVGFCLGRDGGRPRGGG